MSAITLTTTVNQRTHVRAVTPRTTLAEFLRGELGLTGTKLSCEMQVCGVCTVLVNGLPVSACSYLAADIDQRNVLTIEGMAADGTLHPIQEAFIDHFALQCGFCTPGFVMMAMALLDDISDPSPEQVTEQLEGNICRCTGYQPILKAVLDAAGRMREATS